LSSADIELDRRVLIAGMRLARRLLQTPELGPYFDGDVLPGAEVQSDDEFLGYAHEYGSTAYHLIGTARMGPASYDLVSFLLDRQPCPPSLAELRGHRLFFLEQRRLLGLSPIDPDDFALEFRLMTIQRGLKATGTFSCQTAVYGRGAVYEHFIQPTLEIVLQAAEWLERFPTLRRMLKERIN